MAGYTQQYQRTVLNTMHPTSGASNYVAWSTNGSSETSALARLAVGSTGWAAATNATPSVKANSLALTSAPATSAATITHSAVFTASSGGTQVTDWTPITDGASPTPRALSIGDRLTVAVGALRITMD